jgi:MFS family permease
MLSTPVSWCRHGVLHTVEMDPEEPGRIPGERGLFATVFSHAVAEFSAWITVLVVAFDQGGASAAGLAVMAQLVPAAALAPIVGAAGDRFARHRVLTVSFSVLAITSGGIATALVLDAPLAVVYALAAVFTVAVIAAPATVASLLVHYARTPTQLMRWNVTRSFIRAAGILAGPLMTAVILGLAEPAAVFGVLFVGCAMTAAYTGFWLPRDDRLATTLSITAVIVDAWRGVTYVARTQGPRRIVGFIGLTEALIGALDLVFVAVAFGQLDRGGSMVALLSVAFATGLLAAAATTSRFLGSRLSGLTSIGTALLTLPLLVIGHTTSLVAVLVLTALLGAGSGLIEIGGQTLLQRSCDETMTSRAYGALNSTVLIAAAVGAWLAGQVLDTGDLANAISMIGLVGLVLLVVGSLGLGRTERSIPSADSSLVASLRSVSFLAALPQPTLERLARSSQRRTASAGTDIIVQGEYGDEFLVLISGATEVRIDSRVVGHHVAPAGFGEVALLHDSIRTATVTTTTTCDIAVIRQDDFLDAVSRTATSHRDALAVAERYRGPAEPSTPTQ